MQYYHPPPPIPTRETIINEGLRTLEQSKTDQQWLKTWLEKKTERKQLSSNPITLSNYRQKLIQHAHLLQHYKHALENSNYEILLDLKPKIEQSNPFIYDLNTVKTIEKQIHRRESKRSRLRRQKQINLPNNPIEPQSTNEKSFTEKIQDINSILQTIEQLKQLKTIRQQQQQNETTNTDDELTEIQNICHAKLLDYENEMKKTSQSSHMELYNYLFNNQNQSFYESSDIDAQDFLRAHQNLNNLIQIRQTWDRYSSTQISSSDNILPSHWHEPQTPGDSNWTRFIFTKKE